MNKKMIVSVVLAALLLLLAVQPVQAVPPQPSGFWGFVTFNGGNVPNGTQVRAFINGVPYAVNSTSTYLGGSFYFFQVNGDDPDTPSIIEGGVNGQTIAFMVGGVWADQTATWQSGTNVQLNLTASSPTDAAVLSFGGSLEGGQVQLNWETASETDLLGFNLYRAQGEDGLPLKVNPSLIAAQKAGQTSGAVYAYFDAVERGTFYLYELELVTTTGTRPGPQYRIDTNYRMFVPLVRQ